MIALNCGEATVSILPVLWYCKPCLVTRARPRGQTLFAPTVEIKCHENISVFC